MAVVDNPPEGMVTGEGFYKMNWAKSGSSTIAGSPQGYLSFFMLGGTDINKKAGALVEQEKHFIRDNTKTYEETFVDSCIHCLSPESRKKVLRSVLRPMGQAPNRSEPNEVINFKFCYISNRKQDNVYELVIKNDLRFHVCLYASKESMLLMLPTH